MALQITNLPRVFSFNKDGKDIPLVDPNPDLTAEEVMKFYSGSYPELTNGMIEGPKIENDKASYKLTTKAGKLG